MHVRLWPALLIALLAYLVFQIEAQEVKPQIYHSQQFCPTNDRGWIDCSEMREYEV